MVTKLCAPEFSVSLTGVNRKQEQVGFSRSNFRYRLRVLVTTASGACWRRLHRVWLCLGRLHGQCGMRESFSWHTLRYSLDVR